MMFHLLTLCFLVPSTAAALPPASSIKAIPKATNAPEAQMPLAAALKSAAEQSPRLKGARYRMEARHQEVRVQKGGYWPELSAAAVAQTGAPGSFAFMGVDNNLSAAQRIGAGGALKQVLVSAGLSDMLVRLAAGTALSPLLVAWLVAVCIRLATGSATVATITTAGVMPALVAASGASPEWTVLAIGAGSVFFSHVNDPGFWLVKSYLGTDMPGTFKTWSVLETVISVVGLVLVLTASQFF